MNLTELDLMSYEDILNNFFSAYIQEFGERKFNSIHDRVMTSNKINKLIRVVKNEGVAINPYEILYCINEIPYFIFSRGQTQAVAALIVLNRWNEEVNLKEFIISDDDLRFKALKILNESKVTFF